MGFGSFGAPFTDLSQVPAVGVSLPRFGHQPLQGHVGQVRVFSPPAELPGCLTAPGSITDVPSCVLPSVKDLHAAGWTFPDNWNPHGALQEMANRHGAPSPRKWQGTPQSHVPRQYWRTKSAAFKENTGKCRGAAKALAEKCLSSGEQLLIVTAHLHLTAIPTTLEGLCLFQMVTGCIRDQREARATRAPR